MGKKDWNSRLSKTTSFAITTVLWLFVFVVSLLKMIQTFQRGDVGGFLVVILMLIAIVVCGGLLILYWRYYNMED